MSLVLGHMYFLHVGDGFRPGGGVGEGARGSNQLLESGYRAWKLDVLAGGINRGGRCRFIFISTLSVAWADFAAPILWVHEAGSPTLIYVEGTVALPYSVIGPAAIVESHVDHT